MKEYIGMGIKPTGPNLNVINVLRSIVEDKESIAYVPYDYKKESSRYSRDSRVHFLPLESGCPMKIVDITSNKERFNFNILGMLDVMVEFQDFNGDIELKQKKIWRQYSVIRDGHLNIDYILAKLSEETFRDLREARILWYNGVQVPLNHKHNKDFIYKVSLKDIPLISLNWAQPVNIGLYNMILDEEMYGRYIKEIKKILKDRSDYNKYNAEEIDSEFYQEDNIYLKEDKKDNKVEVKCVTYSIDKEKNISFDCKFEDMDTPALENALKDFKSFKKNSGFGSRCVIWAIEMSKKKGSYNWSDVYQKKSGSSKSYQDTYINVNGEKVKLTRCEYTKMV